ncbi:putative ribonuclease H protein [Vitis vinifera]|uniref:Putative ribonuclease H protein n=1 Tax=Vitis vinifera TaxID=29760 RepID=A0A438JSE2_VITVI|nr:putative ribonuclease H protein [Vitis vinifera]
MVIPVGEVEGALDMAAEIGCKVGQLPTVYLGLPLGAPNRASSVWDGVEEKMRRKLALWKRHFLSKGGRITLIKSTLASIPLYQMSLFRMPKSVARRLEKLQRNFLWGGANGGNKAHLIKFARAKEELWKKVLEAKYGKEEFGWRTKKANGVFGVGVWKEILKESTWCWDNMVFKVGKGNKVRFWIDPWCGNNVLSEAFPDLFSMAVQRNATVEDYWDQNLSQGGWSLRLLRDFNDWELGADGLFKVKEAYRVLINADEAAFPHSNVWVAKVPTKIISLLGKLLGGRFKNELLLPSNRVKSITDDNFQDADRAVKDLVRFMGSRKGGLYLCIRKYFNKLDAPCSSLKNSVVQADERFLITASGNNFSFAALSGCKLRLLLPAMKHKSILSPCFQTLLMEPILEPSDPSKPLVTQTSYGCLASKPKLQKVASVLYKHSASLLLLAAGN